MTYPPLKLVDRRVRERAKVIIDAAPDGYVVKIGKPTRSDDQNNKMWAMLEDIAAQCELDGRKFIRDDWKIIFMRACSWDVMFLPDIGDGKWFPAGFKSSRMTVSQMADLITYIYAYGDERGVAWSEPEPEGMR